LKTLIIGGTGHTGANLTRLLIEDGQDVTVMSSGRTPVPEGDCYNQVKYIAMRYSESLQDGSFTAMLNDERPDAVVDILQSDISAIYSASREAGVSHVVACGSLWMFGRPKVVPTPEVTQTECPFGGYRQRYSELLQTLDLSKKEGVALSAIMPPNICGPGKIPLDGMGGRSLEVHQAHQRGEEVTLPYPGTNLVGPCDAEDVARGFFCAVKNRESAAGEIFNVGSAYALTAERFIATYGEIYKTAIPVRYVSAETYVTEVSPELGAHFHFLEHMCPDISKISSRLGYHPRYTPEEAMERAVRWMFDTGLLKS